MDAAASAAFKSGRQPLSGVLGLEYALRLGEATVGRAAAMDDRVERAVADAVQRARVSRVNYKAGGVDVRVSLDLELLWRALATTSGDPR